MREHAGPRDDRSGSARLEGIRDQPVNVLDNFLIGLFLVKNLQVFNPSEFRYAPAIMLLDAFASACESE
jgi:hypothetical protein